MTVISAAAAVGHDGYGVIEIARRAGWTAIPSWGRDGWDLGSWPYVIVFTKDFIGHADKPYAVSYYVEGDETVNWFATEEERGRYIDGVAFFHWKQQDEAWVADYALGEPQRPEHRGPYRRDRT